ncbi:hypothetical protein [Amycolatopsis sp. NPDC057786]|uniref:hypothetical protein n=1 Tax=Amycolatopsis sp. NPDC057786 TaxID=3346250 RepID=UPI003671010C
MIGAGGAPASAAPKLSDHEDSEAMNPGNWSALPGPEWYRPAEAAGAVATLETPASKDSSAALAVGRLAGAVSNDHAGTLYPAAVPAVTVLLRVVRDRPGKPRAEALTVLLDWWGCFAPEPGYASYRDEDDQPVDLVEAIEHRIRAAADVLRTIADDRSDSGPARKMAKELLSMLAASSWLDSLG